jgi:predicted PurR-regulated permease PerM
MSFPPPTQNQARILWFCLTSLAVAILLALGCGVIWAVAWIMHDLVSVLLPATIALILAYVLDPVVEFFVRKKVSRLWSILLVFAAGLLLLGGVLGSVLPGLIRETTRLVHDFPNDSATLRRRVENFASHSTLARRLLSDEVASLAADLTNSASSPAAPVLNPPATSSNSPAPSAIAGTNAAIETAQGASPPTPLASPIEAWMAPHLAALPRWLLAQLGRVKTWAESILGLILVPLFLFYFLWEKQEISDRWADYLPIKQSRTKEETVFVLKAINDCLIVFFRGQVLVALCVGVMLTIAYLILGLNYAVLLGLAAAILEIVPYLGTIITLLLALAVATVQFGDWTHPLLVLCIAVVVKLIEDFLISPKIIGERSGLHPLTVIVALMVGTTILGGVLGALFAIPLTAALRTLMFRYVWTERPRN